MASSAISTPSPQLSFAQLPPHEMSPRARALCVMASAILWWLSLQSFGLFAVGWIALVPLLRALSTLSDARARFWFGWRAGAVCFALINWWILPAIVKGGAVIGASPPVAALLGVLAVFLIGIIHGVGIAIIALLWNPRAKFFQNTPILLPVFCALFWFVFETARASGVLAHSWGAFAFSQTRDVALLQSASVIGQHGLSALCVLFASSLALWLHEEYSTRAPILWRAPLCVFLALHLWGAWRIWDYDRKPKHGMKVLLVQTNVSSLRKNFESGESSFDQAERLTREYFARGGKVDLIVWPETTAELRSDPEYSFEGESFLSTRAHFVRACQLCEQLQTPLLTGAQVVRTRNGMTELSNRAVLFSLNVWVQSSSKTRVVPFGERAPFGEYVPFLNQLAPNPPVEPAREATPLRLKNISIGALICFESCFPDPAHSLKNQGAKAFFVLTNDEWCAGTDAPWEHAAMSTLRAVENDVPVAQSANGGYSFGVDARGRFLKTSKFGAAGVLVVNLPIR